MRVPLSDSRPRSHIRDLRVDSVLGIRSVGLAAALSAASHFDLFLNAPCGQPRIDDPAKVQTVVLLLAVGAAVTENAV